MHDGLITIIVPIYNVEQYLEICINSIVNQTYKKLEIILVDDGSTDSSSEICDKWAKKDSRIIAIHKSNGGGGQARNVALCQANGEYIAFVDSDDYIAPNMYEMLLNYMTEEVDIVECDFINVYDNREKFDSDRKTQYKRYSRKEAMKEHISDHYFRQLIWNKIYRKRVIEGIFFPEEKGIDDEFWTYKAIGNARKLVRIDTPLYAYRQQDASVMHNMDVHNRFQSVKAKCARHDYIKDNFSELETKSLHSIWMMCIYTGQIFIRSGKQNKNDCKRLVEILKKYNFKISNLRQLSRKEKIWIILARYSFISACVIRNKLKIGL